ncbi:hypothetical protein [Pyxidicoccus sp. MSG2]|uniref:hypothetical protein n=1 Tax=Pyxidicoccus sp. MSG2 TaxID=2996790 RepID=UPI00226FBADC|nr:hypothetical protein [Pyxidicoccus sp. MSG2]MCY1015714.1 hypothetical protein [Pyxidicoccus sp. MSG2]
MTQVILGPGEAVKKQAIAKTRKPNETFYWDYLATMTNKRIFAEDQLGTLIFNFYLKDIDRAEVHKSFWKGNSVHLILRNGNDFMFKLMKDNINVDEVATQVWVNTINQVQLVMKNQVPQTPMR